MKFISLTLLLLLSFSFFARNKVIAISYFDNTTENSKYNSLSKGIADMLITDLSKVSTIDIVERSKLEELIKEIKLGTSSYFDQSTAQKLGKGLGASSILTGAFYILDGSLRIDARLINVENGLIIAADQVTGSTGDFFSLHKQLVNLLIKSLSIKTATKGQSMVDYDNKIELTAVVNYSDALAYQDNGLEENASELLVSTIKKYPEFLFAKTKLDKIRAFIAEREKEREALLEQELNSFLSSIDTTSETLNTDIIAIWGVMTNNYSYSSILTFNNQLKKKGINLNNQIYKNSKTTLGEYLKFYDCLALFTLKKYKLLIAPSKEFLTQYPTSMYFNSVKMNLNATLKEIEKIEEGKKNIKPLLDYNETLEYIRLLDRLNYYVNKRFIRDKTYEKYKKIYIKKIIKGNKNTLHTFILADNLDYIIGFFETAEENLDRELMVQIKDLAIELCTNTTLEEDAYDLEDKIFEFDEAREKHRLKKEEALENLMSNDMTKIAKTVQWFWLMRDQKEEVFIIKWSTKYLSLKENRDTQKIYTTRLKAYDNIVEALDRLGDFDEMKIILEQYKTDTILLKNKDREFDSQAREFKKLLREGLKNRIEFNQFNRNGSIESNILESNAMTFSERFQYFDEILCRKEVIDNYYISDIELQYYLLFIAYSKAGLFEEMRTFAQDFIKTYPKNTYSETVKTMIAFSPK